MKTKIITIALLLFTTLGLAIANPTNVDVDAKINNHIETKYKDAVVLETENEEGKIEVKIIHQQKEKKVIFNKLGVWQSTKYDIKKSELPQKIKTTIKGSKYSSYKIDSIETIETPKQSIYEIELEKLFNDDITIYITFDGKIL